MANFAELTRLEKYQAVMASSSWTTAFATVSAAVRHLHERGGPGVLISSAAALKKFSTLNALGRLGAPQDIVRAIAFFLAPENWITGQVLAVDGGLSRALPKNRQTS